MTQQSSRLDIIIDSRQAQRNGEQLRITLNNLVVVGDQTSRSMAGAGSAARAAGTAFAALGAGRLVGEMIRLTDAFKSMQGSLALVSSSSGVASDAFSKLLAMANNTGSSLESTVSLYTRLANATRGAGYSQEQLLGVTDAINKAFVISGATMQEASNAAIQLSQGLASGTLRGEELNSVMEQGPRITRALAEYLGVTNGQIRQMASEGKITAEVVTNALLKSLSSLNGELERMPRRFEQASTALKNNFLAAVGQIDISPLIGSVDALATSLADPKVIDGIQSIATGIGGIVAVGGDGLKAVVTNTDALMAITGAYATKVGVGLVGSLALATKARFDELKATQAQIIAERQATVSASTEAVAIQSVAVASSEAALARAIYARSEAMATAQTEISSVKQLKAVAAQLAADRQLEVQRMQAQINNTGLAASHTRLAEIRTAEAAITSQLTAAEGRLAVARQAELATGAVVGQQTIALNAARAEGAAVLTAQTAAQNALNVAESRGAVARSAGAAAMAALGGPMGLVTLGFAALAGGAIYLASSNNAATKSLIDQGLALEDQIEKFKRLNAEQKQFQASSWMRDQKKEAEEAADALESYKNTAITGLSLTGESAGVSMRQFKSLFEEVGNGQKPLADLTTWLGDNTKLSAEYKTQLIGLANTYSTSNEASQRYGELLDRSKNSADSASAATSGLAKSQAAVGASTESNAQAWAKYIEQLTKTRDLVGANAAAEAEYTARKMGAVPVQIEEAKRIATQTDLLGKYQDAIREGNRAEQERLKVLLVASYAAMQAAEDVAAAKKKADSDAAKSAEESSKRQVTAIEKVATASYAALLPKQAPGKNLVGGVDLLTSGKGYTAPTAPRKTPQQLAEEAMEQAKTGITSNKGARAKAYSEDAGQKMLDAARQTQAVLTQQNATLNAQGISTERIGTQAQALIKWEQQLADIKEKKTLTADQKSLLASQDLITAQLKRNAALEKEAQLSKDIQQAQKDQVELLTLTGQLRAANSLKSSLEDAAQMAEYERQGNIEAAKRLKTLIEIRDVNLKAEQKPGTVEGVTKAPAVTGLDASVGGAYSEIQRLNDESVKVDEWRAIELDKQKAYLEKKSINEEIYSARVDNINQQGRDAQAQIEQAKNSAILSASSDFFGNMAVLSQSGNSKLAAIGKAAAIAQATISTYKSATESYAALAGIPIVGPALGAAAAAAAIVAGLANVAAITGIGFSDGGYTGLGGVNELAGTVHRGEIVWSQADIRRFGGVGAVEAMRKGEALPAGAAIGARPNHRSLALDSTDASGGELSRARGSRSSTVNQTINVSGRPDSRTANQIAAASSRKQRKASRLQ